MSYSWVNKENELLLYEKGSERSSDSIFPKFCKVCPHN